jgi:endonuclease/exonuclease/phosphatase family metal-dependent hydrolase
MRLIRAARLPGLPDRPDLEPRGALWVEAEVAGQKVQLLNTHLGLLRAERKLQMESLLGDAWLGGPERRDPLILCCDLNAMPRSRVYRHVASHLRDVQQAARRHRPQRTWLSRYPLTRIDHIFVSEGIEVVRAEVSRTDLARKASDHLPLIVDLRLPQTGSLETTDLRTPRSVAHPTT